MVLSICVTNVRGHKVLADLQTKPRDLDHESTLTGDCYCLHPLLPFGHILYKPKADIHFTVEQRLEGWADHRQWQLPLH